VIWFEIVIRHCKNKNTQVIYLPTIYLKVRRRKMKGVIALALK